MAPLFMSEEEICANYKQAKNKNQQIHILADLNATKPQAILDILQSNNLISGIPKLKETKSKNEKPTKTEWTKELVNDLIKLLAEGKTNGEIAERLGVDKRSVEGKVYGLRKEGKLPPFDRKPAVNKTPEMIISKTLDGVKTGLPISIPATNSRDDTLRLLRTVMENAIIDEAEGKIDNVNTDYNEGSVKLFCIVDDRFIQIEAIIKVR